MRSENKAIFHGFRKIAPKKEIVASPTFGKNRQHSEESGYNPLKPTTLYIVLSVLYITKQTQNLVFTSKKFRSTIIKDLKDKFLT